MNTILPHPEMLELLTLGTDQTGIAALVRSRQEASRCPLCHQSAWRVHSWYQRTLLDLPWHGVSMRLHLQVRRFSCDTLGCPRAIFTERLPDVVLPYARRTKRVEMWFSVVGLALGGEAGARLLRAFGCCTSPDTLLVQIRALPLPTTPAPRVVGIDDWSYRKGRTFGTMVVDLERHRVIDLLPDREAATVKQWLSTYPGIEVVSHDRAQGYAEAIEQGTPRAVQVADRFHLVKTLTETLEQCFLSRKTLLNQLLTTPRQELLDAVPWLTGRTLAMEQARRARHAPFVERYHQVQALTAKGVGVREIGRQLGLSHTTVAHYAQMAEPPAAQRCPDTRVKPLAAYQGYLLQRWNEGIRNASQLWRELLARGYGQSRSTVGRFIAVLQLETGTRYQFKRTQAAPLYPPRPVPSRRLTPRQAARLFLLAPGNFTRDEQQYLDKLLTGNDEFARTYTHVSQFLQMVRERGGCQLGTWCAEMEEQACPEVQRFARNLTKDGKAVVAGLTLEWSQGQVEGQVNRLKLIKRSAYGQMGFETLRKRVLIQQAS